MPPYARFRDAGPGNGTPNHRASETARRLSQVTGRPTIARVAALSRCRAISSLRPAERVGDPPAILLDQLIRPPQERLRDRQAERLGRLEVDDELVLGGLLDGQVGGLRAL